MMLSHLRRKPGKNTRKGFTLVELIVVLVILAVLAAVLVPALLGWIDRAREEQYVLQARNVLMATQTVADEAYAQGVEPGTSLKYYIFDCNDQTDRDNDKISQMADVDAWVINVKFKERDESQLTKDNHDAYIIDWICISILDGDKYADAVLSNGTWEIETGQIENGD